MNLSVRQRAFFLVALRFRGSGAGSLFPFLPEEEAGACADLLKDLEGRGEEGLRGAVEGELASLARTAGRSFLAEVHDDWILETLREEPPAVTAVVLRYLPGERARFLLENLPRDVVDRLPKLSRSFSVDAALVDVLRRRFEGFFAITRSFDPAVPLEFGHLPLMKAVQIRGVFQDAGYREIAFGLVRLPEATRAMVLRRLLPDDRRRVERYLDESGRAEAQRVKRAQVHLVSKDVDAKAPELFVRELGFLIYAKALLPSDDAEGLRMLKMKLRRAEALILQELTDQYLPGNSEASVLPYRESVVAAMKTVLSGGEGQ